MTLTQMNYIITISETGSLNKAAEALYISQPSLTNAVKELEKELGIIIFNRSGRGVTLTNDGTEFLMYARQIYGQYESVVEKYSEGGSYKKKFGVSTQHYSFAVSGSIASSSVEIPRTIGKKASIPASLQATASFVTLPANAMVFAQYFLPSFATPTGAFPMAV